MDRWHFIVLIFLGHIAKLVSCCGISTHIEVAERAKEFFECQNDDVDYKRLIQRWSGAFEAGHSYPDAFYPSICRGGAYSYVAEDTHWTPFLNVTVNYIRRTYPHPWNRDAERLVVFLLGIVQHQIADVNWHSLGISQGFLRTMGHVNYHGSYGAAHSDGDFGGDVINQYALDMEYVSVLPTQWYVPVADLVEIYKDYYGSEIMTEDIIQNCTLLLFLGRLGENIRVIEMLYPFFSNRSPFLIERLQDYFLGGIDDMSTWTANTWQKTAYMLDNGSSECDLPNNPLYIECNKTKNSNRNHWRPSTAHDESSIKSPGGVTEEDIHRGLRHAEPKDVLTVHTNRGIELSLPHDTEEVLKEMLVDQFTYQRSELNETNVIYPDFVYGTDIPYSRLGESLLCGDFNNDGHRDLAIGAPGHSSDNNYQRGRVYIVYGTVFGLPSDELILENDAEVIIEGPKLNGRFGQSLAAMDYNRDGVTDLVVGAPTVGSDTLQYQGEVYIYFGRSAGGLSAEPDVSIGCSEHYCNLGWSLSTGDLNGDGYDDLVVGAPFAPAGGEQRGFVGVLFTKDTARCPSPQRAAPQLKDFGICETECSKDEDCPLSRKCCLLGCADICVEPIHTSLDPYLTESDFDWRMSGERNYEWFGFSSVVHEPKKDAAALIIGSPNYKNCAMIGCVYSPEDVQSAGKISVYTVPLTPQANHEVEGTHEFSQFGYSLASDTSTLLDLLAVGATNEDVIALQNGTTVNMTQAGLVAVYLESRAESPFFTLASDRQHSRFGSNIRFVDVNGDGTNDIAVGSPHRSITRRQFGRESGQLFIFNGKSRIGQQDAEEAEWILSLDEAKSRFGTGIAGIPHHDKMQLAVSAPHSNLNARLGGRVAIFNF